MASGSSKYPTSEIKVVLCQWEETKTVGPSGSEETGTIPAPSRDPQRDRELLKLVKEAGVAQGLSYKEHRDFKVFNDNLTPHHGGFSSIDTIHEYITVSGPYLGYAGAAATGIAVFIRNVIGSLSDWQKLRGGRSIEIDVRGKKIEIRDGASVDEVLGAIKSKLGIEDDK